MNVENTEQESDESSLSLSGIQNLIKNRQDVEDANDGGYCMYTLRCFSGQHFNNSSEAPIMGFGGWHCDVDPLGPRVQA